MLTGNNVYGLASEGFNGPVDEGMRRLPMMEQIPGTEDGALVKTS